MVPAARRWRSRRDSSLVGGRNISGIQEDRRRLAAGHTGTWRVDMDVLEQLDQDSLRDRWPLSWLGTRKVTGDAEMVFYLRKQIGAGLCVGKHVGNEVGGVEEERCDDTVGRG